MKSSLTLSQKQKTHSDWQNLLVLSHNHQLLQELYGQQHLNNPVLTDVVIPAPFDLKSQHRQHRQLTIELFPADADNNPIFDQDILNTCWWCGKCQYCRARRHYKIVGNKWQWVSGPNNQN
jgi:hypothetical protein